MAKKKNLVGKSKSLLTLLIVLLIAVGWLMALSVALSEDAEAAQKALIETARAYAADGLYVRAAAEYKKAIGTYDTGNNLSYENELLAVYRDAGMTDEYFSLIDSRVNAGTASADEYMERAQQYVERGNVSSAITLLQQGQRAYSDSREITELYESLCYDYTQNSSTCAQLLVPRSDWYVPAFDGERWGYISVKGKNLLSFSYEEATCFYGNYAVVKIDGTYATIDKNGQKNSVDKTGLDLVTAIAGNRIIGVKDGQYGLYNLDFKLLGNQTFDCLYISDNGLIAAQKDGKWAILDSSLKEVTGYVFTDVAVNSQGQVFNGSRAVVADERGYFLINAKGEAYYDNIRFADAKGFEGGYYAVADETGKWGFADLDGSLVLACQYDDAWSFSNRLGAVKIGGLWGYVNKYGTIMIEPQFTEVRPFLEGSALAKDVQGVYRILTLKYYSLF